MISNIAVEHREKQAQAQKSLLIYSLIGSIALHIGLLTLGLGNFFQKSKVEDKPIELTIIETPTMVQKPPEKPKLPPKVNSGGGGGGGGGGGNGIGSQTGASVKTAPVPVAKQPSIPTAPAPVAQPLNADPVPVVKQPPIQTAPVPVVKQPPIQTAPVPVIKQPPIQTAPVAVVKPPIKTAPIQNLVDNSKIPALEQPEPKVTETPQTTPEVPEPISTPSVPPRTTPIPTASPTQNIDNLNTPPQQPQSQAVVPPQIKPLASSKPVSIPSTAPNPSPLPFTPTQPPVASGEGGGTVISNSRLKNPLANSRKIGLGNGSGNGIGNGSGNGIGSGSGNGVGSGSGNGVGSGSGNGAGSGSGNGAGSGSLEGLRVATTTKPPKPKPPEPKPTRLNRAKDCIRCDIKYLDSWKRRGIEGSPEVAIDYDENGKVTNVRLTNPSGKSELDEALKEQAREFVLKPVPGGRQGVRVVGNYHIEGSERNREYQARQRKKEAQAREAERIQRETLTNNNNENPNGNQQSTTGVITDVAPATPSTRKRRSPTPQETLRPPVDSNSPNQYVPTDTLNQPSEGRSERGNRKKKKSQDIIPSPQQPSEPPVSAPATPEPLTPPASNSDANNSN